EIVDDAHLSASYVYDKNTRRQIVFTAPAARVLIVDDSKVNLGVAKGLLEEYGINADIAESGMEALKKVGRKHYDLIFMDHMMPEMDGIETMKNIRLKGNWCEEVPIVALTANTTDEARQLFKMEGMQDFLAKPIELSLLHDILLKWLPKDRIVFSDISEGYIINEELTCDSGNTAFTKSRLLKEGIYLEIGLPYFGGNIKAYKSTMESILKDCKKKVVLLENHFLAGDLKNYAIEAHSVKSVSASIGATAFSDLAKDNELKAKADDRDYIEANGSYFITKYKEFLNSIEQILAEEKQHEAEKQLELADNKIEENGDIQCKDNESGSETNNEERKQEINIKLEKAIEAIDDFEADSAIEILQELHTTDMDPVIIEKVCRASELIDDFEYDEAVEILKKLLE
ncbi:MAG: response regulator, partial [Lachnospiraceae bacterium]|nr:response regulator [Lachnospiraceae bacterium]